MPSDKKPEPFDATAAAALEENLFDEWKIIQGKLDKVGEFKFHVKNWAFTITVAIIGGAYVAAKPWWLPLCAAISPVLFWLLEQKQERLAKIFGQRAERIKGAIARSQNKMIPATAARRSLLRATKQSPGLAEDISILTKSRSFRFWKHADDLFYGGLAVLVVSATIASYSRQGILLGDSGRSFHAVVDSGLTITLPSSTTDLITNSIEALIAQQRANSDAIRQFTERLAKPEPLLKQFPLNDAKPSMLLNADPLRLQLDIATP